MGLAGYFATALSAEVLINEIHFDPPEKTELAEFIEIYNTGPADVNLSGWKFTQGVTFTFPDGSILANGGYVVIAENPSAFSRKFGRSALGPWEGLLANDGETITLRDSANQVIDQVDYQLGFPWPTVGEPPGYSIELVNPAFDNDLGGNWRRSVKGNPSSASATLVAAGTTWKYFKGTIAPSSPETAWRDSAFNDTSWSQGPAPIGYDSNLPMATPLNDMRGAYTSVFLRKTFSASDPSAFAALRLEAMYDDGFKVWINGKAAVNAGLPATEVAYTATSPGGARESANYDAFIVSSPAALLVPGENLIAVQLHNVSRNDSSDCYLDLRLIGELGSANAGPTPGARNAAFDTNIPPQIRQVAHVSDQPSPGHEVQITAKITDTDGVESVQLLYQIVDPGSYLELNDAAYETTWTTVPMKDDGTSGDLRARDDVFTTILPASLQVHRRLVRYRIVATDQVGLSIRAPYQDDPQPNFAYFVYAGVPGWQGAVNPGSTEVQAFSAAEMGRLPTYHLVARRTAVEDATWNSRYTGDLYRWWGTLVYNGQVYDHIRYRARGGVWRYAMGKNMWKFDFNRGHDFQALDDYGREYATKWRKLNLGANIQQADFQHRGEQGMFESVGFKLFNLAGVESPKTHWATFRVVDEASESSAATQYNSDFWGLYLAIEQEDGRFLDEHGLPDGNLYKMENYNGELNNQGRTASTDGSDLAAFTSNFRSTTPDEAWWRSNFDVDRYYSYQAIAQGIHHYDICFGKNYFYYLHPETKKWSVHTWDLDLTWADNMYESGCGATDEFKNRVSARAPFNLEYKNRVRELRDLLFNTDQAWKIIDEYASIVRGTNPIPNILAADRAMWDYNPVMRNSSIVNSSKSGQGRFYQFPLESANNPSLRGSFEAAVQIMKTYVTNRSAVLDNLASDPGIPARPTISYTGGPGYPLNRLQFNSSVFSGSAAFAAMKWRVGEVRRYVPGIPGIYEIEPLWESQELSTFAPSITVPTDALKVGHTYRARVRFKDSAGRWSNWSTPIEFLAAEPDNAAALVENLRVTELMYNPPAGNDFEFIELHNSSPTLSLQLAGVAFTEGIDFTFSAGALLAPDEYALLIRGPVAEFRAHYGLGSEIKIFGPYTGALNNDGEKITLKTATAGTEISAFTFKDRAGWPIATDGAGHSLVLPTVGNLDYGRNSRSSYRMRGSPGAADPTPVVGLVLNEVAAHTDYTNPAKPEYDSNDWIELFNAGPAVSLGDYYLSDAASDLKKWRLPNIPLASGALISFDEVTHFHSPITAGFGLNKAGEELYLSVEDRVVDAIRFKGQENATSWGRYADGGEFFRTLVPSRDFPNAPAPAGLVISEIMYRPGQSNTVEEPWQEYVEIHNLSSSPISLADTNGAFRLDGGMTFAFATNSTLEQGGVMILVSFDPANVTEKARFTTHYGIQSSNMLFAGPFTGRLDNSTDRIAIEKPEAPDLADEPIVWVIVDEAIYADQSGADATGESLTRLDFYRTGNDPANLRPSPPTPGWVRDSGSPLKLHAARDAAGLEISFDAHPAITYTVQYRETLHQGGWTKFRDFFGVSGRITVRDQFVSSARYYRIVTPALP